MDHFEDQFLRKGHEPLGLLPFDEGANFFHAEEVHDGEDFAASHPTEEPIMDNPVRVYLREMGAVSVLTREGEINSYKDYQLDVLRDGEAAIQFVEAQRELTERVPCVIVLDWHLPKHDGAAVLKAIRREPLLDHVNIVALTTVSPEDEQEITRLGVRLYASKPMELDGWQALALRILDICRRG